MCDALAEARSLAEGIVKVERLVVARDLRESDEVGFCDGFREGNGVADGRQIGHGLILGEFEIGDWWERTSPGLMAQVSTCSRTNVSRETYGVYDLVSD